MKGFKAQTSLELVFVLAVILLIVLAVMSDFSTQASKSFTLAAVKQAINNQQYYSSLDNTTVCNTTLSIAGKQVLVNSNCIDSSMLPRIADEVESGYCKITPNHDDKIDCGEGYELVMS